MNFAALYHESRDQFCYAVDDNLISVSIRTGQEITGVDLIWGDPFDVKFNGTKHIWNSCPVPMTSKLALQNNLLWSVKISLPFKRCKYYFKVSEGENYVYFLEDGVHDAKEFERVVNGENLLMGPQFATFTFPWLNSIDVCRTPQWAQDAVFYQIFPSRFAKGELGTSVAGNIADAKNTSSSPLVMGIGNMKIHDDWPTTSIPVTHLDVYGGNLQGIIDRLDYLQDLGVTGIYLTPINKALSQHKYDTTDYLTVDPSFGTNKTMTCMVKKAHEHGIRIMVDGVFNHCGWDFFAWQDVLKNHEKSKYAKWFIIKDYDIVVDNDFRKMDNALQGKYYSFAFTDFMPKLNTGNTDVQDYLIGVCKKWVDEYDIDGIRLDVANELSHDFIRKLRLAMCAAKPDFYILGEAWHNVQNFLRGDEFSSSMNYPLENVLLSFSGGEMTALDFEQSINRCQSMYYEQVTRVLFNQLDSHDTMRFVTKFGGNKERAKLALALLFTLTGTACIYYGTEILLEGKHDPDCRRCMPWAEIDKGLHVDQINFTKSLIRLRKENDAFREINIKFFYDVSDKNSHVVHYQKVGTHSTIDVIINNGDSAVDAGKVLAGKKIMLSSNFSNNIVQPAGFVIFA